MGCMTALQLKRLGEAAHGLAAFLGEGEPGWVFVDREDATNVRYAMSSEEYSDIRNELEGRDWIEIQLVLRGLWTH